MTLRLCPSVSELGSSLGLSTRLRQFGMILLLVCLSLSLAACEEEPEAPIEAGTLLFPNLQEKLNTVARVETIRNGEKVSIYNKNGLWVVENFKDFSADFALLKQVLLGVATIEIVERKTANPENFAVLGLQDTDVEGSQAYRVILKNSSDAVLADILLGKQPSFQSPTPQTALIFARRAGEDQTWLIKGRLRLPSEPLLWLQRNLLHIDQERVQSVSIEQEGRRAKPIVAHRASPYEKRFTFKDTPKGKEPKDPYAADAIGAVLSRVRFDGILAKDELSEDTKPKTLAEVVTFDGLKIKVLGYEEDNDTWVTFATELLDEEDRKDWTTQAPETAEGEVPPALSLMDAEAVAADHARLQSLMELWLFKLPDFKIKRLTETRDTLFTEKADEE